jgi:hydrogenase maturation protease
MTTVLVVGYGNTLRGDDGLGPRVATVIADRNLRNVRTLSLAQLTPELAEPLAHAQAAIFIDSVIDCGQAGVTISSIAAVETDAPMTHQCDPRTLLALAHALYRRAPAAWLVTVAGEDFGLGETPSEVGTRNLREAVNDVAVLIRSSLASIQSVGK